MTLPDLHPVDVSEDAVDPSLLPFFRPRGIVVVGATPDTTKLGYALARNLVRSGYGGAVHFVNPKGGTLFGRPIYTRVEDVPDPADLAVLLIPAAAVPGALHACGARGLRAAIVESGGFRETGPAGRLLEEHCLQVAHVYDMRLIGPNGIGWIDTHVPFDLSFLAPQHVPAGDVAFVSQSGAICAAVLDWARGQGLGLSHLVSLGNQADVTETDVLAPLAADPHARVLMLYLEGVRDGRRFVDVCRRVSRVRPILALKAGRSEGGRRAVVSHTGALAGHEAAYNAAFRRGGVLRVQTTEELFDGARVLSWCPLPAGPNVAVLTNAGGPGATAADAVEACGLRLARLGEATQAALRAVLPPAASVANPVDLLASATPDQFAAALRLLLDDAAVHSVLVLTPPPPVASAGAVAWALLPLIAAATKPVVVALMGDALVQEAAAHLRAAHVPDFRFPERAAAALALLARRADQLRERTSEPVLHAGVDRVAVADVLRRAVPDADGMLPQEAALALLAACGVPAAATVQARTPAEAVAAAHRLGFPVALKVAAEGVSHKSDVGGVLLGLACEDAVTEGFATLVANARAARPNAAVEGVYVQPMVAGGHEVIVGVARDPQFGPLVMFGAGGVDVEDRRDVAFALAPLPAAEAARLVDATGAGRRLRGFRNRPPADRAAALDVLRRLAQLAADFDAIEEIDVNPLVVHDDGHGEGHGACAVDVRVRVRR